MNPIERMNYSKKDFTKTEQIIYEYILNNPTKIVHGNIYDIADWSGVSRTAILRFAKKLGYAGFSEFKYDFSRIVHSGNLNIDNNKSALPVYDEIIEVYQKTVSTMKNTLKEKDIKKLIDRMIIANKVKIFGLNRTGLSAKQLRQRFHKIDFDAEAVTDYILIPEIANQGHKDDVHIYFSTLGETPIILEAIRYSKKNKVYTALITMNNKSPMIEYADVVFYLPDTNVYTNKYFFDLQAINFVFVEIIVSYLGNTLLKKENE